MNPPLCEHLQPLLDEILSKGIKVGYSGMAWSKNCRTWIYLENTLLDCDAIYLLPGWSRSRGATVEHAVTVACGIPVLD